jgi:Protein of unknown function (DUF3822)
MDKYVFYFQDENLNAEKALRGTLKMIVGTDGISIMALSAENDLLGLEAIQISNDNANRQFVNVRFREILAGIKLLDYRFGTVRTALSVPLVTLVPDRLFSFQDPKKYFQLLHPTNIQEVLFDQEKLASLDCHVVWGAAIEFQDFVNRYQPRHLSAALINNYHNLIGEDTHTVFLNIRDNVAQITVFHQRSLLIYNTFEFGKPTDLLYFVMLIYDQFKLRPEEVPLHITGALLAESEGYKLLSRYIRHLAFITPTSLPKLPKVANKIPVHFWFDVLSL